MVEPIKSAEVLGQVRVSLGEAPKHTQDEHRGCAYYPMTTSTEIANELPVFVGMRCPHGVDASGAFYSEDYVRQLKGG